MKLINASSCMFLVGGISQVRVAGGLDVLRTLRAVLRRVCLLDAGPGLLSDDLCLRKANAETDLLFLSRAQKYRFGGTQDAPNPAEMRRRLKYWVYHVPGGSGQCIGGETLPHIDLQALSWSRPASHALQLHASFLLHISGLYVPHDMYIGYTVDHSRCHTDM